MSEDFNTWLIVGGLTVGLAFGVVVQRSRFCMVAAVSNLVLIRDTRQLRAIIAALAVALLGTQVLESAGWVAVADASYRSARIDWAGAIGGGLMFGFGAMLAGGCAGRTVVGAAEGNGGALLTLMALAIGAMASLYGVIAPLRQWLASTTSVVVASGDASVAKLLGFSPWLFAVAIGVVCLAVILVLGRYTASKGLTIAGIVVGGLIVAGWLITGYLSIDEFDYHVHRPASVSFAGPVARAGIYLVSKGSVVSNFSVPLLIGVLLGSAGSARLNRTLRWRPPQVSRIGYHLTGGLLMGVGATFAGGCNIGNGLSGISTCSLEAIIATTAIVAGMRLGLGWLQHAENG